MELTLDEENKLRVRELPPEENSDYSTPSAQPKVPVCMMQTNYRCHEMFVEFL